MNPSQETIGHLVTLPSKQVGVIKAITQAGNYWVKLGNRYVLASPDKVQVNGRNILPDEERVFKDDQ